MPACSRERFHRKGDHPMKSLRVFRSFSVCLTFVVLVGTAGWAQQKYRLQEGAAAGDVALVEGYRVFRLKAQVAAVGQPAREFNEGSVESDLYHEKVLAAGPHGPTAFQRTYGR